jgi:hypothetical protein
MRHECAAQHSVRIHALNLPAPARRDRNCGGGIILGTFVSRNADFNPLIHSFTEVYVRRGIKKNGSPRRDWGR